MDQQRIGAFLKELRKGKAITQEQLAERLNVARRTVSRWETGSNLPDLDLLIQLADYYQVDLRELLDGERKDGNMDKKLEDTVTRLAEYSHAERLRATRTVRTFFVLGIMALAASALLSLIELDGGLWIPFVKGLAFALALVAMAFGMLHTTDAVMKVQAFKRRLLRRKGQG